MEFVPGSKSFYSRNLADECSTRQAPPFGWKSPRLALAKDFLRQMGHQLLLAENFEGLADWLRKRAKGGWFPEEIPRLGLADRQKTLFTVVFALFTFTCPVNTL